VGRLAGIAFGRAPGGCVVAGVAGWRGKTCPGGAACRRQHDRPG